MLDLIRSTSFLSKLESLHLPRSSDPLSMNSSPKFKWPVTLRELHISGGLRDSAAPYFRKLPPTLSYLSIRNCSNLTIEFIQPLIKTLGPQLHSLDILAPLPHVHHWPTPPLDLVLDLVPNLTHLKISVDLISIRFFEGPRPTSLTRLDLHCHDRSNCQYIEPLMVYNALGTDAFAKVRIVGVHYKLQWDTRLYLQDLMDLEELLIALAREDEAGAGISEAEAGVKRLTGP